MSTHTTKRGHQAPYFSPHDVVMMLMRNHDETGKPEFVLAYIHEEIRRDPTAFMTESERSAYLLRQTFTSVKRSMEDVWRTLQVSLKPAIASVTKAFQAFGDSVDSQSNYGKAAD